MPPLRSDRRAFLALCSSLGLTSTLFPGILWGKLEGKPATKDMIAEAATVAGITIPDEHQEMMVKGLNEQLESYEAIRKLAYKWQRIVWRMWQERQPYDETRYLQSLQKRGLKIYADLAPQPAASAGE